MTLSGNCRKFDIFSLSWQKIVYILVLFYKINLVKVKTRKLYTKNDITLISLATINCFYGSSLVKERTRVSIVHVHQGFPYSFRREPFSDASPVKYKVLLGWKDKKNLLLRTCSQELKVIVETFLDTEVTLVWRLN